MIIKGDLISDLELRLSSAKPSDDSDISRRQLSDWIDIARDTIVSTSLDRDYDNSILKHENFTTVSVDSSGVQGDRYYIELAFLPLVNNINSGVIKVINDSGSIVSEERFEHIEQLRNLLFSKPSSENLVYYAVGKKIYIEGLTSLSYLENDFRVSYIPSEIDRSASETDTYFLSPSDKDMVLRIAFDLGMDEIARDLSDTENDGE